MIAGEGAELTGDACAPRLYRDVDTESCALRLARLIPAACGENLRQSNSQYHGQGSALAAVSGNFKPVAQLLFNGALLDHHLTVILKSPSAFHQSEDVIAYPLSLTRPPVAQATFCVTVTGRLICSCSLLRQGSQSGQPAVDEQHLLAEFNAPLTVMAAENAAPVKGA